VCGILTYNFGLPYALVTLATILLYTIFTFKTTTYRIKIRKEMNRADNNAAATATDSLLNYEQVQLYTNESHQVKQYDDSLLVYEKNAIRTAHSLSFLNAGQQCIFSVSLTLMMLMAAEGIVAGVFTIGDLVMMNALVFQLSMPLNFLGSVYRDLRQSLIDMEIMFTFPK
jgi:ABC transporter ATM